MANLSEKKITDGLTVENKDSGHWLCFEINGKKAAINIETKFAKSKTTKNILVDWAESQLYK